MADNFNKNPAKKNVKGKEMNPFTGQRLFNFPRQIKYLFLIILCFIYYGNTLMNEYALDDNAMVLGNAYVQKGFGGISKILTTDAWNIYLHQSHSNDALTGGRYRPLSLVFFAIEQSLFGESPLIRHLINIIFFIATVLALFYFLDNFLFQKMSWHEDGAFTAALLFTIHPLHTEVVANVKSFDEIISLFFILVTFIFCLEYTRQKRKIFLVSALGSFFLALLSKEYAITLLLLIPLLLYINTGESLKKILSSIVPYLIIAFVYLIIRISIVRLPHSNAIAGHLSMNNLLRLDPYFLATPVQKLATEQYALGKYLLMLFIPYPLSSDYSYNQIPYHNMGDVLVILSTITYMVLIGWNIKLLFKKSLLAFPLLFFLVMLLPVSNFIINVGAIFAERFDYHPSVGFVIIMTYLVFLLLEKINFKSRKIALSVSLVFLILISAPVTFSRNKVWKNNYTLFMNDVKVAPSSEFMDDGAAAAYINLALINGNETRKNQMLDTAIMYCHRAIAMDKTFPDLFLNAGLANLYLNNLDSAKYYWDFVKQSGIPDPRMVSYQSQLAKAYLMEAKMKGSGNPVFAIRELRKGISEDSTNAELWFNLAGAYSFVQRFDSAEYAWIEGTKYKHDQSGNK